METRKKSRSLLMVKTRFLSNARGLYGETMTIEEAEHETEWECVVNLVGPSDVADGYCALTCTCSVVTPVGRAVGPGN